MVPGRLSFICDAAHTSPVAANPRTIGRAALKRTPIWHFSTQGLPHNIVTNTMRRLLPYVFTLTFIAKGGHFLWHCL